MRITWSASQIGLVSMKADSSGLGSSVPNALQALPQNVRESYADPASSYSFGWSHGKASRS